MKRKWNPTQRVLENDIKLLPDNCIKHIKKNCGISVRSIEFHLLARSSEWFKGIMMSQDIDEEQLEFATKTYINQAANLISGIRDFEKGDSVE